MYKAARTIAAEGTTITKGFHNLRRIPRRLVPHCGNLNPTYVSSGPVSGWAARPSMSAAPPIATENSMRTCSSRCARSRRKRMPAKVYASQPLSPVATQHSLPSRTPTFNLDRTCTGWIAPACGWRTYSITSSALASRTGGTSRPSARTVTKLITRSNLVGCSTPAVA